MHTDAVPVTFSGTSPCTGVKVNDRRARRCCSSHLQGHFSGHRSQSRRPPCTRMRFLSPPETLACYAQHTPDNQTITNFRVHPKEHPKERILLNIIELPGIDMGGLAYLARRIKQNVSSKTNLAKRIWHDVSGTTCQPRHSIERAIPISRPRSSARPRRRPMQL